MSESDANCNYVGNLIISVGKAQSLSLLILYNCIITFTGDYGDISGVIWRGFTFFYKPREHLSAPMYSHKVSIVQ